jgi:hypothetical protein
MGILVPLAQLEILEKLVPLDLLGYLVYMDQLEIKDKLDTPEILA